MIIIGASFKRNTWNIPRIPLKVSANRADKRRLRKVPFCKGLILTELCKGLADSAELIVCVCPCESVAK